jgi:hypothetical protein
MERDLTIDGRIVDSWTEPSGPPRDASRLVLQVVPRSAPGTLVIVEASASMVPDAGWLEDLGENLCHGSPVTARGRLTTRGLLSARQLRLDR